MANSTASLHTTATQPRKRKPLAPARVYQAWAADVSQHGRRGSFRRTADLVGCSPEYIRQLVAKHEAAHTLKPELFTAHELDYLPAPGETPLARPAQPVPIATNQATAQHRDSCASYVKPDTDLNLQSCETGEATQPAADTQPQGAERENAVLSLGDLATDAPLIARAILEPFPNPDPLPGPVPPPIPNPMPEPLPPEPIPPIVERGISLRDDYARRRSTPAVARLSMPALDWGQLLAYTGPVLLLAFLLYQIVLSAAR